MSKVGFSSVKKLRVLVWMLIVALFFVGVAFRVQAKLVSAAAAVKSLEVTEKPRFPVTTMVLKPELWETRRSYYGRAKSAHTQEVTALEREVVKSVHVQLGDRVKSGQLLVTLSTEDRSVRVQAQRTGYEEALRTYNRLNELRKKGGISQAEVDRAFAAMKAGEASLKGSQSTLQRTELRASIEGIVSARNVEPGEVAEMGRSLLSIVDPSNMEVELMVSKRDIFGINKDTSVDIYIEKVPHPGWVKRSSPEAQVGSGLYRVVVGLVAKENILPGTYVEGRFLISSKPDALVIPSDIIVYRGKTKYVYVVDGDSVRRTEIETGEGREGRIVIVSGLKTGDEVVVSGNRTLYDGALVAKNVDFGEDAPKQ